MEILNWLREHASRILENLLATLAAMAISWALRWAPGFGFLLRTEVRIPVWLLVAVPILVAGSWQLHRRSEAANRARDAWSFDKLVRELDAREKPKNQTEL